MMEIAAFVTYFLFLKIWFAPNMTARRCYYCSNKKIKKQKPT